jgi:DNA-binding ferritin-like protein
MYTVSAPTAEYNLAPAVAKTEDNKGKKIKTTIKLGLGEFIPKLISHASYANQLYAQSHLIHFNYEAVNFLEIHKFLRKQYETHLEQFDTLSEFVRSMDYMMPMCACGLHDAYPNFNNVTSYDGKSMLVTYLKNLEDYGIKSKDLGIAAKMAEAPDVENYSADLVRDAFKSAWFIKASLRKV